MEVEPKAKVCIFFLEGFPWRLKSVSNVQPVHVSKRVFKLTQRGANLEKKSMTWQTAKQRTVHTFWGVGSALSST